MQRNIIIGQSGGPTAVINSSLAGVFKTAKDRGAGKIYGMRYGIHGLLEHKYVDLSEHIRSDLDIDLLKRTPSSFLGSCRYKLPEIKEDHKIYEQIFSLLQKLEIEAFFYIGGNDSMDTIQKLLDYGHLIGSDIRFMGVPKTIDNDLSCTDHTPGYGSAAKFIAATAKEIIRDGLVYDIPSVTIMEIMGRNAGWLTGAAALAKGEDCEGVDLICLPEVPFDPDAFLSRVKDLLQEKKSVVIAVSEGITTADGKYVFELAESDSETSAGAVDAFGHKQLSGVGKFLADLIAEKLAVKTRAIELNTLQRCAAYMTSRVDVTEAFQVGGAAVKAAFEGESGKVAVLERISEDPYLCITGCEDVHKIANKEKKVPRNWISEDGMNVTEELIHYIRPLIQAELSPMMVDGLPRHLILR